MTDTAPRRLKLEQRVGGTEIDVRVEPDGRLTIEGEARVVLELAAALFTAAWSAAWAAGLQDIAAAVQRVRDAAGGLPEIDAESKGEEPHYDA